MLKFVEDCCEHDAMQRAAAVAAWGASDERIVLEYLSLAACCKHGHRRMLSKGSLGDKVHKMKHDDANALRLPTLHRQLTAPRVEGKAKQLVVYYHGRAVRSECYAGATRAFYAWLPHDSVLCDGPDLPRTRSARQPDGAASGLVAPRELLPGGLDRDEGYYNTLYIRAQEELFAEVAATLAAEVGWQPGPGVLPRHGDGDT